MAKNEYLNKDKRKVFFFKVVKEILRLIIQIKINLTIKLVNIFKNETR